MRFRPGWLHRVLQVPVVPTLGPVHPDTLRPELFDEVAAAGRTGEMLPFDKERRWSASKSETVLVDQIVHRPDLTIIPTLTRRGTGMIKTHVYSPTTPDTAALRTATRRWCTEFGAATGRVLWFTPEPPRADAVATTRVLLKPFTEDDASATADSPATRIRELDAFPHRCRTPSRSWPTRYRAPGSGSSTGAGGQAASTARYSPRSTTARSSGRSARSPCCPTATAHRRCSRSTSASPPATEDSATAVPSGAPR